MQTRIMLNIVHVDLMCVYKGNIMALRLLLRNCLHLETVYIRISRKLNVVNRCTYIACALCFDIRMSTMLNVRIRIVEEFNSRAHAQHFKFHQSP